MHRLTSALLIALALATPALAVPGPVPYSGQLTENGVLVTGTRDLTIRVYDNASAGALLYSETFPAVPLSNGIFQLQLNTPASVWTGQDRWIGLTVSGGSELVPRTRVGNVPYALTADGAGHADALTVPLSSLVTILGPGLPDVRNNVTVSPPGVWWTVIGRTLNFTKVYPGSKLRITYQDTIGTYGQLYDGCEWRILLDGVSVVQFSDADADRSAQTWTMSNGAHVAWATAAAGAHTLTIQNRGNRGAWGIGTTECLMGWNTTGNFISVEEIP